MGTAHWKYLAVVAFLAISSYAQSDKVGYILLVPKVIYDGEPNKFTLEVVNATVDGKITMTVKAPYNDSITYFTKVFNIPLSGGPLYQLDVSDIKVDRQNKYDDSFKVVFDGVFGTFKFNKEISTRIKVRDSLILVQTDKKIYKPGQKVNIRAVIMDYNLKPISDGQVSVEVADPNSNVVATWVNVSLKDFIVQFDFTLTDEPPMGGWQIRLSYYRDGVKQDQGYSARFSVAEYTLPKFEVKITPPPFILADATSIKYKICANYTFGKPVRGTLKVNATLTSYRWDRDRVPENYNETQINGCLDYVVNTSDLNFTDPAFDYRSIRLFVAVFEDKTKDQMNATAEMGRTNQPLKLSFLPDSGEKYFRAYMNTYGGLKVTLPDDTPAPNEPIELCLVATSQRYTYQHQRTDVKEMCKNYTSDSTGMINYILPPHKPAVVSLVINAKSLRYPNKYYPNDKYRQQISRPIASTTYKAFYSPTGRFVQFEPLPDTKVKCNTSAKVSAYYVFKDGDTSLRFKYVVMARSQNIISKIVEVTPVVVQPRSGDDVLVQNRPNVFSDMASGSDAKIGIIDIDIQPNSTELPQLTVLLYYISGSEVITDSIKVQMEVCSKNNVTLEFSQNVIQPGDNVGVTITGSPSSRCGYDIVDKSVTLLSGSDGNPFLKYRNTMPDMEISSWQDPSPDTYSYCSKLRGDDNSVGLQSDYADGESVILTNGWQYITNLDIQTRPCRSIKDGGGSAVPEQTVAAEYDADFLADSAPLNSAPLYSEKFAPQSDSRIGQEFGGVTATATVSKTDVRDYFPENWLFDSVSLDASGVFFKNLSAPHTVTTWDANAMCINMEDGLGVAESKQVKTYQAFFADARLPYSVKRGENLPIIISVSNYLPECMPVNIKVDPMPGLKVDADTPLTKEVCVCSDESPLFYEVRVTVTNETEIGNLNVTVTATNSANLSVCSGKPGAKSPTSYDKVTRQLKVVPEGFMLEVSESRLLCPKTGAITQEFNLTVPDNVINGSSRSLFSITGDIMGQALSNVDNLVLLPTGCGEQNMAKFSSNLAVFDYLSSTGKLEPKMEQKILANLKSGYQNELKYRNYDGSYSAFGGQWSQPSTFLTAMVLFGFTKAKGTIFVDDNSLTGTRNYLLSTQNNITGCFDKRGEIYSWPLRASSQNNDTKGSYSAYVLVSFGKSLTNQTVIKKGLLCVSVQKNMNPHALAISAYAAALFKNTDLANKYLDQLEKFANTKTPNQKFYSANDNSGSSESIETASYAVLARLELDGYKGVEATQPVVRWLMKKQNRNGGFSSSQDTVLGLQAMATFAILISKDQATIDNTVKVSGEKGFDEDYHITKDNAILWDTKIVKIIPNLITATSKGSGCVVLTSQLRYNIPKAPDHRGFNLDVKISNTSTQENVELNICVSYEGAGGQPSLMAIVELELLSGYSVDKPSLDGLIASLKVQLYEANSGNVILYFNEFGPQQECFNVLTKRDYKVKELKSATVKVYDYYDTEQQKSVAYERGDLQSEEENV